MRSSGEIGPLGRQRRRETVVLIHGLASHRLLLRPLERFLQKRGYDTLNVGYRSVCGDLDSLIRQFSAKFSDINDDAAIDRFHIVAHSMGSVIVRGVLVRQEFPHLGRVVNLAPPHRGSRVATLLARPLGWFCRPLRQLSHEAASFVNQLPVPGGCSIGIVAASHDRVVRIEDTSLGSETDHVVVNSGHTRMLFQTGVAELVVSFLQAGAFRR